MPSQFPRIALATCRNLPGWEADDLPFERALRDRGVELSHVVWDAPDADWSAYDAVLIRTTWDYMERRDEFVQWAERVAGVTRLMNPAEVVRWNTDKHYLRDLAERGVRTLPTAWLERGSTPDLDGELERLGATRGFLKPAVGAKARETLRFDRDPVGLARARAHCARLLPDESLILQPYQESVEHGGELSVIFFDGEPSHAVRKVPVSGDYRVQDDFGALDAPEPMTGELEAASEGVLARAQERLGETVGPLLYARVDFLRDDADVLCLNELELVEPSLFFRHDLAAADRLAEALLRRLS